MENEKLQKILSDHDLWLKSDKNGKRANLQDAYLRGAYLQGADLRGVDLSRVDLRGAYLRGAYLRGADLSLADLRGAYLQDSDLRGVDLRGADLRGADLSRVDLRGAYLRGADLRGADLGLANIDYSSWPLWCGSVGVKIDDRIAKQLIFHAMCNLDKNQLSEFLADPIAYANGFHRVGEVKKLFIERRITMQKNNGGPAFPVDCMQTNKVVQ
jgi:hypothetical protein